jgi:hypothetical protein
VIRTELVTGYGTGRETELISVWHGSLRPGGIPLICCHGFLGTATQGYTIAGTPSPGVSQAAAERNIVSVWPDHGAGDSGLSNWGHDDVVEPGGSIDDSIDYLASRFGTRTDQVGIYGTSMGGTALGWVWRNPDKVAAAAFTIPCVALGALWRANPIGLATYVELAYVNEGGISNALVDHDPSHPINMAKLKLIADRIRLWYSSNDNVIAATDVQAFAAATGITAVNVGAVGHSLAFDQGLVFDWLLPRLTPLTGASMTVTGTLTVRGNVTRAP